MDTRDTGAKATLAKTGPTLYKMGPSQPLARDAEHGLLKELLSGHLTSRAAFTTCHCDQVPLRMSTGEMCFVLQML